jgi:single-stranded DNA-binding protein
MNECIFLGKVVEELKLEEEHGINVLRFRLSVKKYRKSKKGKMVDRSYLNFEAWDTGASTIFDNCVVGDSLLVKASARSQNGKVSFRINEFNIVQPVRELNE